MEQKRLFLREGNYIKESLRRYLDAQPESLQHHIDIIVSLIFYAVHDAPPLNKPSALHLPITPAISLFSF